jgi:hypothetical protein
MFSDIFGEKFADLRKAEPKTGEIGCVGESSSILFMFCTYQSSEILILI